MEKLIEAFQALIEAVVAVLVTAIFFLVLFAGAILCNPIFWLGLLFLIISFKVFFGGY